MNFEHNKNQFLSKRDRSFIGKTDKAIIPLVNLINSKKNYYTTSSCAGRITLLRETGEKQEKIFNFVTHNKTDLEEIKKVMSQIGTKEMIYFKHEPCILHVACKTFEDALAIVTKARDSGWKKSGIISRKYIIELVSTEILATPIMNKGKILIEDEYLKLLITEANSKLVRTRKKIASLEKSSKELI